MNIENEDEPLINCYIFEVMQWPRYGRSAEFHVLHDVWFHNSMTYAPASKMNSRYIKVPEYNMINIDIEEIVKNKNDLIGKPVIKRITEENWTIDYSQMDAPSCG